MTKAETIEYAIKKECQRYSLADWCESWNITIEEFYRFLELGRKAFEGKPSRWIQMTERPPDLNERVLVLTNSHDYFVWDCMSDRGDNYFWEDESGYYHNKYDVTAWMPLFKNI